MRSSLRLIGWLLLFIIAFGAAWFLAAPVRPCGEPPGVLLGNNTGLCDDGPDEPRR